MTPKEKAKELVGRFESFAYCSDGVNSMERQYQREDNAQQCALIAVDEIINAYPHSYEIEKEKTKNNEDITIITNIKSNIGYWQEVKQEIIKL